MYYINTFFLYSFLGILFELIVNKIEKNPNGSGILYGPWTPIYGVGSILILLFSKFIFNVFNTTKIVEILIVLVTIMIILTILEWIGGILIEKVFHVTFWDYRRFKFNLGKYVALEVSLIWGIGALLIIYIIQPLLNKILYIIPNFITYILIILFILDILIVFSQKKIHK